MRVIQRRRKSRFLFLRSRYAYRHPRSTVSFAAFHSFERPPYAPRAAFMICFLRLRRATFDLTRGIARSYAWIRRLMFRASPGVLMVVGRRRFRFRFADFLVRMWLLNAFRRRTLPLAVMENRFLAPLWVFIFGMLISVPSCDTGFLPRAPELVQLEMAGTDNPWGSRGYVPP